MRATKMTAVATAAVVAATAGTGMASEPAQQPASDAAQQAVQQAIQKALEDAAAQAGGAAQVTPGIPVPDGPVVQKAELEGGLIVEDIVVGTGYEVPAGGAVVAHYHGTRKSDGVVFDSSFQRGEPVAFPLDGVIQGWQKGVPGMKVGGVRRLTIPAALGYGERGAGPNIPPNTDLVFVIQLEAALEVQDVSVGTGEEVLNPSVVETIFTVKDAEGKELFSSGPDKPYIWIPGEYQPVDFGVPGMKVGGKRTLKVPAQMNNFSPSLVDDRPQGQAVTIEIEVTNVRNLPRRR